MFEGGGRMKLVKLMLLDVIVGTLLFATAAVTSAKTLNVPCISIGSTFIFSRIHSPNEFARVDLLKKTTKCICLIMDKFGT